MPKSRKHDVIDTLDPARWDHHSKADIGRIPIRPWLVNSARRPKDHNLQRTAALGITNPAEALETWQETLANAALSDLEMIEDHLLAIPVKSSPKSKSPRAKRSDAQTSEKKDMQTQKKLDDEDKIISKSAEDGLLNVDQISDIVVEKKICMDDTISTRWLRWMASQCTVLNKDGQAVRRCTKLEDFFKYGLLIFEFVKRVLPVPSPNDVPASSSPPRVGALHYSRHLKFSASRAAADAKKTSYAARSGSARDISTRNRPPASTLWIVSEPGWGGYAGKKDAFAGLRLLIERQPDVGRQLPAADQIEACAPRACRQVVAVLRSLAVTRAQGDVPVMLEWYRAAVAPYGVAAAVRIPAVDSGAAGDPGGRSLARQPSPAQLWAAFRDGVVWACALHAVAHCRRQLAAGVTSQHEGGAVEAAAAAAGPPHVDLERVYGDPRTLEELGGNLGLALSAMAGLGVPVLWAAGELATYPGEDDAFLLLQVQGLGRRL